MSCISLSMPDEVVRELQETVAKRDRSAFVAEAVREKLDRLRIRPLEEQVARDYLETRDEDRELNREWEAATLEGWPEY